MVTIRNRLYWGFGTLIMVLIATIVMIQVISRQSTATYEKLKTEIGPTLAMLDEYRTVNRELLLLSINKITRNDAEYTNRMKAIAEVALPHFKTELFLIQQSLLPNDPKIEISQDIISHTNRSIEIIRDINLLLLTIEDYNSNSKIAQATQLVNDELTDLSHNIEYGIAALQKEYNANFDVYQSNLSEELNNLSSIILTIGILGILLGITIASKTIRSIVRPIRLLQTSAQQISDGSYEITVPIEGKDELASLGNSFNTMATSLQKNFQEIKQKNKELEQFVYIASHDLQEPLRTLNSFTELFEKEYGNRLDKNALTYLQFIDKASTRMSELVMGLLDHSQIGQSKKWSKIDCNTLLADVLSDLNLTISKTNTVICADQLPMVEGYSTELRLLFQNLIGNAIKFRKPDSTPRLMISAEKIPGFWKFGIADNGIGIPKQYQEKIFGIFLRLHSRNEYEGTGIGLAHCRKIVEMHGGSIWATSEPENGSTFYFTISDSKTS